jgi:hypothetical protein
VMNWLTYVDVVVDQETSIAKQKEYSNTGLWIFGEPMIKAWLDISGAALPMLWINGIPGAGMILTP